MQMMPLFFSGIPLNSNSLITIMNLMLRFGSFPGFKINWDKSFLFPLDDLQPPLPNIASQVQTVHNVKYLGVEVSRHVGDYITLNLKPLLIKFTDKCRSWIKLPLTEIGRTNLVKMIWSPQLLYILHNAPIWITFFWFRKVDSVFLELISQKKTWY